MKRFFSLFLCLLVMLSCCAVSSYALESVTYRAVNGGYVITGLSLSSGSDVVIPSSINTIPVIRIDEKAFYNNSIMTSVVIPPSVGQIGKEAFAGCAKLETVTFSGSANLTIETGAFKDCTRLKTVSLPENLSAVSESMFSGCCLLENVALPDAVITIGKYAFSGCSALAAATIPRSTTSVGDGAFVGCSSLASIGVAGGNTHYISLGGVLYTSDFKRLQQFPSGNNVKEYSPTNGTQTIAELAFAQNTVITSVTLPDSMLVIEPYAFSQCTALAAVKLSFGITDIGSLAFNRCTSLKEIIIPPKVVNFDSAFYKSGLESVTICLGVKRIGCTAFEGCESLSSVTIPDGVQEIGTGAFLNCPLLTTVDVPASVTVCGADAFGGTTNASIPVKEIRFGAPIVMSYGTAFDDVDVYCLPACATESITLSSENPDIVYVTETGKLIGCAGGEAVITASSSTAKAECSVTVTITFFQRIVKFFRDVFNISIIDKLK